MTPDEQIVAIAEMCPFVFQYEERCYRWYPLGPTASHYPFSPLTDLNACAEMERTLTEDANGGQSDYRHFLRITAEKYRLPMYEIHRATTPQRCEAFLRTIGKWKE